MSTQQNDQLEYEDEGEDNEQQPKGLRARVKQLEKELNAKAEVEKENARYKQLEAARKAGLELNETQFRALQATHEGESTPELLRKTAEELGFAQPIPDTNPDDVAAHQQFDQARTGAQRQADTSYEADVAAARNAEELRQVAEKHGRPFVS